MWCRLVVLIRAQKVGKISRKIHSNFSLAGAIGHRGFHHILNLVGENIVQVNGDYPPLHQPFSYLISNILMPCLNSPADITAKNTPVATLSPFSFRPSHWTE